MNVIQKGIVTLLKSAVTEEKLELPEAFDIGEAYPVIHAHKIAALIYDGALRCGISQQHPTMQKLMLIYCKALQINGRQMAALERIYAAFETAGIDYLPLKGSMMKAFYPKPELRIMGDADILIRAEQCDRIKPELEKLGFHYEKESDYEITWISDALHLELHRSPFACSQEDLYDYFGSGWALAKVKHGARHAMTAEDSFLYIFAHFAKHFRGAGIGCRHMVDLWVYLRSQPALDEAYIERELDKLHLRKFYRNIRRTLAMWFEDGPADEQTELITELVFSSGNWGKFSTRMVSREVRKQKHMHRLASGKMAYVLRRIFPNKERMHQRYPVLKKAPWRLPVVWPYYLVSKLLKHDTSLKQHGKVLREITADNIEARRETLRAVDLVDGQ